MHRLVSIFLLSLCFFNSNAQIEQTITLPYYNNGNGGTLHALLYNVGTTPGKKYPLLVFCHGSGEAGTNLAQIYNSTSAGGPCYFIEHSGWPVGFHNYRTGATDTFIVVAPQTNNSWSSSGADINGYVVYMVANYPVDTLRIYGTGLSSGGGGVTEGACRMDGNENNFNFPFRYKFAAIVPMSLATLTPLQTWANVAVADSVPVWGHGDPNNDTYGENTQKFVTFVNNAKAGFGIFTSNNYGHGGWANIYIPSFRQTINGNSVNIYEWMLTNQRIGQASNLPTANAGSNQTINQPATTCTLTGSGSVAGAGHTLSTYAWTKLSGPSCTITSPSSTNTGVTGMTTAGAYVFQLTVTDNASQTSSASVTVTVVSNLPTANSGSNHTVTLPTTSVSLTGTSGAGAGHTVASVGWSKISGPNTPTITTPTTNNTTVTGLIIGTYVFRFTVTDDASQTATSDNTTVVVAASYASPQITVSTNQTITLPTSTSSLTSSGVFNGASQSTVQWTKFSVPTYTKGNVVVLGSSYSIDYGASVADSGVWGGTKLLGFTTGRFYNFYHPLGLFDSLINLGVTGTNIYQAMATGFVPSMSIQAKLSPNDTPHVASNITAALTHHPKIVILVYPTNGYDVFTIPETVLPFQAIYDTCVAHGVQCYIMTTSPRTDGTFSDPNDRIFLKTVSDTLGNRFPGHVINIYDAISIPGQYQPIVNYASADSIHMDDAGQTVMFNCVQGVNVFKNLLSSGSSISTPTTNNTNITGLTLGVNKFQATVTDTHQQQASGVVTITVNNTGTAIANAGSPITITLPTNSTNLNGTASTGATSYVWTQISGPNNATLANATTATPTASNLIAGVYIFQLAINSNFSDDQVAVTVNIQPPVGPCQGAKYFLTPDPIDSSIYDQSGAYNPGDTLVINGAVSTLDLGNLQGRSGCPIVVISKSSVVNYISKHVALNACQYVKFTGSGSNNFYGFFIQQDPILRQQSDHGFEMQAKSKNIEVERVQMHNVDMGFVAEGLEDCDTTLNFPAVWMDSILIHDNKIVGTWNEGMYIGNTSPDNASYDLRPVVCNGVTSYPAPAKNGYIHIYNNIVDSTGRGGIQVSNASKGISEINNNTVKHNGMNGDDAQGSAITLGLYTRAYVHDNTISCTYTWGIASIGAGATNIPLRIENNHIDSSGYLNAYNLATTSRTVYDPRTEPTVALVLTWPQNLEIDTRPRFYVGDPTNPGTAIVGQDSTQFSIKNNVMGIRKNVTSINLENNYGGIQVKGNTVCGNTNFSGSPATILANNGITFASVCLALASVNIPIGVKVRVQ